MQYYRGSLRRPKSSPPLPGIGSVNPDEGGVKPASFAEGIRSG